MTRGTGRSSNERPLPSHGSSNLADSSLVKGLTSTMPGCARIAVGHRRRIAVEIAPGHRAHLDGDFAGDLRLPLRRRRAHQQHRAGGDRGEERHDRDHRDQRAAGDRGARHDRRQIARPRRHLRALVPQIHQRAVFVVAILLIDMQPSLMQHQPPRVVLVHQRDVVGGDDHRGAGFVQLDEQPQQPPPQRRIDVAGRLIRQ